MTDAEFEKQKGRIERLYDRWQQCLGLKFYRIVNRYHRDPSEMRTKNSADAEDGYYCVGRTSVRWYYLEAFVDWNLRELVGMSDDRVEEIFVHEMCHILVHEMRGWADEEISETRKSVGIEHEERVVTMLARAFLWTREAGTEDVNDARKAE